MTTVSTDVDLIVELEDQRFDAMVDRDFDKFESLAHPEMMYTHSNGATDSLESYLQKCREGFYVYHRIDHPVGKVVVSGDTAVVLGSMTADITVNGNAKKLDSASIAVWARTDDGWKFLAYQPTPRG